MPTQDETFRELVRTHAERGMLLSPTELNDLMGSWYRYNHLGGNRSKIRIEEFKRVGAIKDRKGHWMKGPLRTSPDGRPCWCNPFITIQGETQKHDAVCRHHQLRMPRTEEA